jgi:serine protease Do
MKSSRKVALAMASALIIGTSMSYGATDGQRVDENFVRTSVRTGATPGPDFTKAAENSVNAVVSIKSFATPKQQQFQSNDGFFDPFEFFFGPNYNGGNGQKQQKPKQEQQQQQKPQQLGLGSGVIISPDGYIVTNNHVIDGAEKLEVTLNDNETYNAKIIGSDPNSDIALLKIEAKKTLPTITFGNSDDLKVGEWVLAVGNPFGLTSTVTAGIVSAKARSISSATHSRSNMGLDSFIQTDAAVNPGNSGGALINSEGELVGINTAIYSQTGNYAGYSFAIPSSIVKKVVTDLKQYGTVQRAVLGVKFQELDADFAKDKGITATNEGVYVAEVVDRSAAMEGGLKVGDVIVKVNGADVKNSAQMVEQMNKLRPGDKATITYYRDNKLRSTVVTLKNNEGGTKMTKSADMMSLGCAFKALTDKQKQDLQVNSGVEVVGLKEGKFKKAGIKEGFVITDINNAVVSSQEDVENIYNQIMKDSSSDKVMFITGLYPTGKKVYYAVDLTDGE